MDGTLAGIFLIASLTDMGLSDCRTACFQPSDDTARLSFQVAAVEFQNDIIGSEVLIGYDFGAKYGPYQPTLAASVTDAGGAWVGIGAKWTTQDIINGPAFVEASLLPGIYLRGDEVDIGGRLQFRSSVGIGYEFDNGAALLISYDHRSNAETHAVNPGLETIAIRYSVALD